MWYIVDTYGQVISGPYDSIAKAKSDLDILRADYEDNGIRIVSG